MTSGARRCASALLASVALVAVVVTGCGGGGGDSARAGLAGVVRTPPLEVGTVTLPDAGAGDTPFTTTAAPGGLLLVYFGYTSCPDICPTTLSDIGRAVQRLPAADRERVRVAMVTVDPARDTGEVLTSYLDEFVPGGGVALRTTDPVQQQAAQDAFRVIAKRIDEGNSYSFEHTAVTYAVDDRGTVVLEWPFGVSAKAMARDLGTLLRRADDGGPP